MKRALLIIFILIPLLISGIIFILPDREISENENRNLKKLEEISFSSLQSDIEKYLSDQFPLRESIVSIRSRMLYLEGRRDINGCYICKDRFIQKITQSDIDIKKSEKYAEKINLIAETTPTYVMYVPSAVITQSKSLPDGAYGYDYDSLYSDLCSRLYNAKIIDIKNELTNDGAYYLTDHHWTAYGAYSAYVKFCEALSEKAEKFEFEQVTKDFKGTLFSKALIKSDLSDTIEAPVISADITVTADGREIELYDKNALDGKDKYSYFQGGNHAVLEVKNNKLKNGRVLLILKDSFANSFLPYLVGSYEKIIMVDERYAFVSPSGIIEDEGVSCVLVLKEIASQT